MARSPRAHRLGPYRLDSLLGRGAMGEVWAAVHALRGTRAAVKVLPESPSPTAVAALRRETRAIARLDHLNIVALYDQGIEEIGSTRTPWLAMELAEATLQPPEDWDELAAVLVDVASGLAAAHAVGILHLDLKPTNVLRQRGRHLLADFGISFGLSQERPDTVWGTPAYMAPEAFAGRRALLTRATDLYSLGCLAWTLTTGAPPFSGTATELSRQHREHPVPTFSPVLPVPVGFEAWLRRLLAKRPGDRFDSAAATLAALHALDRPVVEGSPGARLPLAPTQTLQVTRELVPAEAFDTRPGGRPAALVCPPTWPSSPHIDGWSRGGGLFGLAPIPWVDRPKAQAPLWRALLDLLDGNPRAVTLGGWPGAGRRRLLQRFLSMAHRHAGAEPLLVGGDLRAVLQERFGSGPLEIATRAGLPLTIGETVAARLLDDPEGALRQLVEHAPRPFVIGVDRDVPVPTARRALIVRIVDGPANVFLEPLDPRTTRRLVASWTGLGSEAVARVCHHAGGDLQTASHLVHESIRAGVMTLGAQGWTLAADATLTTPPPDIDRWRPLLEPLLTRCPPRVLARVAVRSDPRVPALTDAEASVADDLRTIGLLDEDRWTTAPGRHALLAALGDVRWAHRELALRLEGWEAGEHLLRAGDPREASSLLFGDAWRLAARGQMARVDDALRQVGRFVDEQPEGDVLRGQLAIARARLGGTHQGYEVALDHARQALRMARRYGFADGWHRVGQSAAGHLLHMADVRLHPAGSEEAEEVYRELVGDTPHLGELQTWVAIRRGDPWRAMRMAARAFHTLEPEAAPDHRDLRLALTFWVAAAYARRPDAALHYHQTSRAFLEAGYLSAEMDVLHMKAEIARWNGENQRARELYARALRVAAEGEARSDIGPFLGAALAELDRGEPSNALDLLAAARNQVGDAGASWNALVHLYTERARHTAGEGVREEEVLAAVEDLRRTGYLDADVLCTLDVLRPAVPIIGPVLDELRARRAGYEASDAALPPIVAPLWPRA